MLLFEFSVFKVLAIIGKIQTMYINPKLYYFSLRFYFYLQTFGKTSKISRSKYTCYLISNQDGESKMLRLNSSYHKELTHEFRIDRTHRLLIIPFFATLPNLIQHSLFINLGGFCQPPFIFQIPRLLTHVHSPQRWQREA